jgi:hypothetical protein
VPHIAEEFKQAEYLDYYDWQWLKSELAKYPANESVLSLPALTAPGPQATQIPSGTQRKIDGRGKYSSSHGSSR